MCGIVRLSRRWGGISCSGNERNNTSMLRWHREDRCHAQLRMRSKVACLMSKWSIELNSSETLYCCSNLQSLQGVIYRLALNLIQDSNLQMVANLSSDE